MDEDNEDTKLVLGSPEADRVALENYGFTVESAAFKLSEIYTAYADPQNQDSDGSYATVVQKLVPPTIEGGGVVVPEPPHRGFAVILDKFGKKVSAYSKVTLTELYERKSNLERIGVTADVTDEAIRLMEAIKSGATHSDLEYDADTMVIF